MLRPVAYRTCSWKTCTSLATTGTRCAEHADERYEDRRPNATARGYGSTDWRARRTEVCKRDVICQLCFNRPAAVADHWPTERRDLVAAGVTDPDAPERLRGLCIPCHNRRSGGTQ